MKKLCLLITACLFLLIGCDMDADPLAYQNGSIHCTVAFSLGESEYEATVSLSAPREDGTREREIVIESPETLRGVCVNSTADGTYLILDGIKMPIPETSLSGFFDITDAFSIDGNIESIETEDGVNVISILSEAGRYRVYLDSATRTPKRIAFSGAARDIEIRIKNFNK